MLSSFTFICKIWYFFNLLRSSLVSSFPLLGKFMLSYFILLNNSSLTNMFSLSTFDLNTIALGQSNSKNAWSSSSTWLGSLDMLICN
jgi:hypothetical protein